MGRKKKTTKQIGEEIQFEFGEFLKTDLGYEKINFETPVPGRMNKQGTKVDIIAERLDERGKRLKKISTIYLVICGVLLISGFLYGFNENWDDDVALMLIVVGGMLEIAGFIALLLSDKYNKENAWVECKNRESKINKNDITTLHNAQRDYKDSNDKKYKVKEVFFASKSDYINNALEIAEQCGIVCYQRTKKNKFEIVKFWN